MRPQLEAPAAERPAGGIGPLMPPAGGDAVAPFPRASRAEVRDVMAWLALLTEPGDAAAAVRALGRPPVELRQVDLAQIVQVARRRKLDVVAALDVACESSQLAPQARERIERFRELHGWAREALAREPVEVFVVRLAERLGLRRRELFAPAAEEPVADAADEPRRREDESLRETLGLLREEVLADVARIAGRLGELRLDTDLDVSHGVVRYLELIKLAALLERREGLGVGEALPDLNARLLAAATPLQREIYESSPLDERLTGVCGDGRARPALSAEPSLAAFLPRRGEGLMLSASDVETYRGCPLRYKYGRVLRIPTEQTLSQRFGIVVHQVLERYHGAPERTLGVMMELLEAAWRRAGLGEEREEERRLHVLARAALVRYHERLRQEDSRPRWFERSFAFALGPHHIRGRVDRVDELPDGGWELIDYKTGHARTARELGEDVQLSLYAIAAREAWQLEPTREAYHYLLDDSRVPVPQAPERLERVRETVLRVGEGIMAQDFEPTPSPAVCALCDYRIVCPAAER
ncbi:MAG TPA: PD-(D/E)XK nuclease family protein [Solirubrobacteraceae bacterium]|nr:PD-(D/E)XK nuclease family protein [Solirubrobacteraceae bacterium]